jgi:CheY-like chemotaxis protein
MLNHKTSILFVDDDVEDAELLRDAFLDIDNNVQFTHLHDGWDAIIYLQKLKKNQLPQLIILDLNMRIINGFEFLKLVKNEPRFSSIPVVMYSTSYRERDKKISNTLGAASFMSKPETEEGLTTAARQLLDFSYNLH